MTRKIALRATLGVVVFALAAVGVVGWIGSERALHPSYYHYDWSLASYPDLHPQAIEVNSSTGVKLEGRFFPGSDHALIILASGYGDTQDQMIPIAEFLHNAGFNTLTYNMRARTPSGGEFVTLGQLEQQDLISVVNAAAKRSDVDPGRIGVLGISMGASAAVLAAARDQQIRAVVDDCGFSDAPGVITSSFEHFIHLPPMPFAPVTIWIASARAGIDVNGIRPMDVIGRISPRPILIIHGLADKVIPVDHSKRNFAAAGEPKELWLVPGAGHGQSHTVQRAAYEKKVIAFFQAALH
jgi:fermentation-respiration switch protein FrsA (DUF1100 family)